MSVLLREIEAMEQEGEGSNGLEVITFQPALSSPAAEESQLAGAAPVPTSAPALLIATGTARADEVQVVGKKKPLGANIQVSAASCCSLIIAIVLL